VLAAILSRQPLPLLAAYAVLAIAVRTSGVPLHALALGSLLPAPLVGLFAISQWDGQWAHSAAIVGKGIVTALASLTVAATTPYPDLLAPLTRVLPVVVGDSLVLAYRSIFILAGHVAGLATTIRARGGLPGRPAAGLLPWPARGASLRRRAEVVGTGGALALLRGVDLSSRLYEVMRLRGYAGRLAPARSLRPSPGDWRALLLGVAVLVPAAAARLAGP
jgi:hypothetical protein